MVPHIVFERLTYVSVEVAERLISLDLDVVTKSLSRLQGDLAEIEAIANGTNSNVVERLRKRYEFQMNRTEALADRLDSMDIDSWITNRAMHHIEVLTELRERLPEQALLGLDKAIEASSRHFGVHMRRVVRRIQQVEGEGVNATRLKVELEALRSRVVERVREFREMRGDMPTSDYEISIDIPEIPSDFMGIGNRTRRGPP
jgi:hypothetical protein